MTSPARAWRTSWSDLGF